MAHAVWLNTQNNAWLGSKISIICCELSRAPTPPNLTPGALPVHPAGKLPSSRPFVPPIPPNSGYATGVQVFIEAMAKVQTACKGTRDVTSCRGNARHNSVPRNRATLACRGTTRRYSVQRNRATPRGAEGPRDATCCVETARCHLVQRDRAMLQRAEKPRERCHLVQRDRATLCGAEKPRDARACRETA